MQVAWGAPWRGYPEWSSSPDNGRGRPEGGLAHRTGEGLPAEDLSGGGVLQVAWVDPWRGYPEWSSSPDDGRGRLEGRPGPSDG